MTTVFIFLFFFYWIVLGVSIYKAKIVDEE